MFRAGGEVQAILSVYISTLLSGYGTGFSAVAVPGIQEEMRCDSFFEMWLHYCSWEFLTYSNVKSDQSHWIFRLIRWNFNLFPFEFIYSDCTIRSGLVSHSQNYSTLWLYIYIYCWYYGIKWIFTVLDMYEIIPILYKSRPM